MLRNKLLIIVTLLLLPTYLVADGKVKITSNTKGAYIYVDGTKKAMTGDGATTITVSNGEHEIIIKKTLNDSFVTEGVDNIFVGDKTEIEIFIETQKKPTEDVDITTPENLAKFFLNTLQLNNKELFLTVAIPPKEDVLKFLKKNMTSSKRKNKTISRVNKNYKGIIEILSLEWDEVYEKGGQWEDNKYKSVKYKAKNNDGIENADIFLTIDFNNNKQRLKIEGAIHMNGKWYAFEELKWMSY